jgi:hypothetical protein
MPETAVYKDNFSEPWENDVGTPRQIAPVKSIPISGRMNEPPDGHLGGRIPALYGLHRSPSDFRRFHLYTR